MHNDLVQHAEFHMLLITGLLVSGTF